MLLHVHNVIVTITLFHYFFGQFLIYSSFGRYFVSSFHFCLSILNIREGKTFASSVELFKHIGGGKMLVCHFSFIFYIIKYIALPFMTKFYN